MGLLRYEQALELAQIVFFITLLYFLLYIFVSHPWHYMSLGCQTGILPAFDVFLSVECINIHGCSSIALHAGGSMFNLYHFQVGLRKRNICIIPLPFTVWLFYPTQSIFILNS